MSTTKFKKRTLENDRPDDFLTIEVGGRNAAVFRPTARGKRLENYYVKGEFGGRILYQGTGVSTKGMAKEIAGRLWKAHILGQTDIVERAKLKHDRVVTLGEIEEAYRTNILTFAPKMKPKTIGGYVSALKSIARPAGVEFARVPISALNENLVEKFYAAHLAEAVEGDILSRDRRMRGARDTLRNAKALFGEAALKCYRGLKLPDLNGFLKASLPEAAPVEHGEISAQTMGEIFRESLWLREEQPAVYLAHLLYRHCGLRNGEVESARVEWLERGRGQVHLANGEKREIAGMLNVKRRAYFEPKQGSGAVPLDPRVWAEILTVARRVRGCALEPMDFIVPAQHMTERAELVDRAHGEWLRRWVDGHQKVSYELRRWASTVVARRQGDEFADRFLRHKSKSVAGRHYLTGHAPIAPITWEDCGI